MIACRDHIHTSGPQLEQLGLEKSQSIRRGVFRIDHDEVGLMFQPERRKRRQKGPEARKTNKVSEHQGHKR
jgi:hypothetical protein